MTAKFDPAAADHAYIKSEIMLGNALPDISLPWEVDHALEQAGFEILVHEDLAETIRTGVPWYKAPDARGAHHAATILNRLSYTAGGVCLINDSAGMPSCSCRRQIILSVSERLRFNTS